MIEVEDFFDIDNTGNPTKNPINRLAFSKEDILYKIKYIKAMQDLGMEVTIDKIGNICGTIPGKLFKDKSIICGSHTDSVDNGGQFDGPLGVYAALKTAENIINSGKENLVNYKAIIYASEESTRFAGKACLGSKYLRGDITDFDSIKSRNNEPLSEILKEYKKELSAELEKNNCQPIKEVDKVIDQEEIVTALEGHIQQSDDLKKLGKQIGICTSITAPYRVKIDINDIKSAAKFICKLNRLAKKGKNLSKYRATACEFSIKHDIEPRELAGKVIICLRANGKNNHSGATAMNRRQDAVYGIAQFIENVSENPDITFLEVSTPNWGANQINDCCEVKFAITPNSPEDIILNYWLGKNDAAKFADIIFEQIDNITEHDKESGLFIDIRQQIGMSPKDTSNMIFENMKDIMHKTGENTRMHVTAKGEPFQTSPDLVNAAEAICKQKFLGSQILQSWAGHDLATLTNNPDARTLLLFCPSTGGSHNPEETTSIDDVKNLTTVESTLAIQELERANKLYLKETYSVLARKKDELKTNPNLSTKKIQLKFINNKLDELSTLAKQHSIELNEQSKNIER